MATKQQIEKALRVDDAARARQAMTPDERHPRFSGNGLPPVVRDVPADEAELLSRVMTPRTWQE